MNIKPLGLFITFLFILLLLIGSCGQQKVDQEVIITPKEKAINEVLLDSRIDDIWDNTIPEEGTKTAYGISLSLDNTQQFIDWFYALELNEDEIRIKNKALDTLVAPCCDEYPVSEC